MAIYKCGECGLESTDREGCKTDSPVNRERFSIYDKWTLSRSSDEFITKGSH